MSTVTVDDQDSSVVHTGSWSVGGTSHENAGTVSSTTSPGDSLTFSFTGTKVSVYGTLDSTSAGVTTTYTIDGGSAASVVSPAGSGDTYKQLFWSSSVLSGGHHTLVVTVTKVNSGDGDGEGTIWFDYFTYEASASSTSVSSTSAAPAVSHSSATQTLSATSSSPTTALTTSGTTTAVATSTTDLVGTSGTGTGTAASQIASTSTISDNNGNHPHHSKTNIGAIVGGVVGGLALIAIIIALFLLCRRRRRAKKDHEMHAQALEIKPYSDIPPQGFPSPSSAQPFLPPGAAPPNSAQSSYYSNAPLLQPGNASVGGNSISERPVPAYGAPSTYSGSNAGHGTYSTNGHGDSIADLKRQQHEVVLSYDPNVQPQLRQHTDSGVRAVDPTLAVDLPPVYTAE